MIICPMQLPKEHMIKAYYVVNKYMYEFTGGLLNNCKTKCDITSSLLSWLLLELLQFIDVCH